MSFPAPRLGLNSFQRWSMGTSGYVRHYARFITEYVWFKERACASVR
jgi:hypothetical protein